MRKTYIAPAFLAVELNMRNIAMLSASNETGSIMRYGGEGTGEDIGVKGVTDVNVWDEEW